MMHCRGRGYAKHIVLVMALGAQLFTLNSCVHARFLQLETQSGRVKLQNLKHKKGA
jgi:hypothetical protein